MYVKVLFGENAIRAMGQLVVQQMNDQAVSVCGTFIGLPIPKETHDYYLCEIIIRPFKKASTSEYTGHGLPAATENILRDQMELFEGDGTLEKLRNGRL